MEDLGERTLQPTQRRLRDARDEGHVARSSDLAAAIALLAGIGIIWFAATPAVARFAALVRVNLSDAGSVSVAAPLEPSTWGLTTLGMGAAIALPILIGAWLAACASHFVQIGWVFAPGAVQPRISRISPASGLRRIFGSSAFIKSGMDVAKVVAVLAAAAGLAAAHADRILLVSQLEVGPAAVVAGGVIAECALWLAGLLAVLGLVDLALQKWKHHRHLRMNPVEVREELKQAEGDLGARRRRQAAHRRMAGSRPEAALRAARVIIAAGNDLAVAVSYDEKSMRAPHVVAKGRGHATARLREQARGLATPVIESPELAAALYRASEPGREIPRGLYQQVAEILARIERAQRFTPHSRELTAGPRAR